ncbi:transposase [Aquamicrobium lusatiense]|uniref:Transposase n=1 Tax=Aquamicrobium lusatiense TaxID=89772 RepID=A0A7W9S0L7_9HYPH|nr:transposase [Aquamicrobium lusatiense]
MELGLLAKSSGDSKLSIRLMSLARLDPQRVTEERFGITYHERYVGTLLKELRFAHISARPHQPADQRYRSACLFGTICPACGISAGLALTFADTMQLHLDEISRLVPRQAHAVLLPDRAGRHTTAKLDFSSNMTLIVLPSRAPELNPVRTVWQSLRQNWISNRVFEPYDAIIEAICDVWQKLLAHPGIIKSIGARKWAHVGQSI